jgi:DNA polymerase-3 subunit gamma/tau
MYLFNRLNNLELAKLVQDVCLKQQIKMDDKAIEKVVNLADGSARDVLSIVEQLAIFSNNEIDLEKVNKVFGLIDDALKIDFIKTLISGNTKQLINLLDQYVLLGANLSQLTHDLISILIDKLIYSQTNDISILKILTENNVNTFNLDNNKLIQIINV